MGLLGPHPGEKNSNACRAMQVMFINIIQQEMVGTKENRTVCVLPKDICNTVNC